MTARVGRQPGAGAATFEQPAQAPAAAAAATQMEEPGAQRSASAAAQAPAAAAADEKSAWAARSAAVVARLSRAGDTLACAESLTAGLVAATIADTPGASLVLRGGIVAYAADVKVALLGVPASVVESVGTVDREVALAMAEGARQRLHATWGVATTGVAGPGPAEGKPAGTVHVAVAGADGTTARQLALTGTRTQVRAGAVAAVLDLLLEALAAQAQHGR